MSTHTPFRSAVQAEPSSPPRLALHDQSKSLLEWTKQNLSQATSSSTSARPECSDPDAELVTLLYALQLLSRPSPRQSSIRVTLAQTILEQKVQASLCDPIEDLLDGDENALSGDTGFKNDEVVEETIWRLWPVGDSSGAEVCGASKLAPDLHLKRLKSSQ